MAEEKVMKALGEKFSYTIANSSAAKIVIALFAAFYDTLNLITELNTDPTAIKQAGFDCDVVLADGVIMPTVTATSSNSKLTIRQFQEYLKHYGRTAVDMVITASNSDVFNETMQVIQCTPLSGSVTSFLELADFKSVDQQDQLKINLKNVNLNLAFDTLVLLPLGAGRTITISFKFS